MLSIIISNMLLRGAIKTFIVKPIVSATVTLVPHNTLYNISIAGFHATISSRDIASFGLDTLADKFMDKKLEFKLTKLSNYLFSVSPENEFAHILFTHQAYSSHSQLLVDLTEFEKEVDAIIAESEQFIDYSDEKLDQEAKELLKSIENEMKTVDMIVEEEMKTIEDVDSIAFEPFKPRSEPEARSKSRSKEKS